MLLTQSQQSIPLLQGESDLQESYLAIDSSFQKELSELMDRFIEVSKQEDVQL